MTEKITLEKVFTALDDERCLIFEDHGKLDGNIFNKKIFGKIMMESGLTTSIRRINELWNSFLDFGYLIKVNQQDAFRFKPHVVCKILPKRYDPQILQSTKKEEVAT
jgi:mRNA deadenylase subunit